MLIYFDEETRQYQFNETELYAVSEFREIMETFGRRHMMYLFYWCRWSSPFHDVPDEAKRDRLICQELNHSDRNGSLPLQRGFYNDKLFKAAVAKYNELEMDNTDPDFISIKYMKIDLLKVSSAVIDMGADNWSAIAKNKTATSSILRDEIKKIERENKIKISTFGVGVKSAADRNYDNINNEDEILNATRAE